MESITTQQEILIVTGTAFTSRQYHERDTDGSKNLSPSQKLQEACWNGLVQEMIPEVFFPREKSAKLYLWQLREANHFLSLEMGEYPQDLDSYLSLDPYLFLMHTSEN